jgi:hypothetical protein
VEGGEETWLPAVVLDPGRLQAPDRGGRERFLSSLGETRSRVALRQAKDGWTGLYGGTRLRLWMLAAAALLLLAEGAVSFALRPAQAAAQRE